MNGAVNITFWICILFVGYIVLRIFIFSSFKIPSNSMEPGLIAGDYIFVCKPVIGTRLLNPWQTTNTENLRIYRLPGFRRIRHNDVIVFNFPYTGKWDSIQMDINTFYVKRCIGLPGDTLSIKNGFYRINGEEKNIGIREAQLRLSQQADESFIPDAFNGFPHDTLYNWTIKNLGPLYIPKAGDSIRLTTGNLPLYKKLIAWEQGAEVKSVDTVIYIGHKIISGYRFKKDYYFVAGDRVEDSKDSRYWGVLPEEFIVGHASFIWKSKDSDGKLRPERCFKAIH